ncbi:hypothetical protein [Methylobacterium platani]|uniref:Uncharacterized protein n=1 Tax=Methylobacterium platani TaxID=427683 RepID=A0A179SBQ6_9HYPH|nr:hypothetical protein [Methylobacterium platani]OAS25286.1 hypothetical protein A5481_10250 [Methylobacterium platani]
MSVLRKLAFVHRHLWRRDATYRVAFVIGPPPLLGAAVAAAAWFAVQAPALQAPPSQAPSWAVPQASPPPAADGPARVAAPVAALPAARPDGGVEGHRPGWQGSIHAIAVAPTFDVDIRPASLARFSVDHPGLDMAEILAAGGPTGQGLYVGVGDGLLVVRHAGTYALSLRYERATSRPASCLGRMVFAGRRLVSEVSVALTEADPRSFEPVPFVLQPGLYPVTVAFGCWRDGRAVEDGRASVLLRRPGEAAAQPLRADELVRPAP